jgi:hypothetical protein
MGDGSVRLFDRLDAPPSPLPDDSYYDPDEFYYNYQTYYYENDYDPLNWDVQPVIDGPPNVDNYGNVGPDDVFDIAYDVATYSLLVIDEYGIRRVPLPSASPTASPSSTQTPTSSATVTPSVTPSQTAVPAAATPTALFDGTAGLTKAASGASVWSDYSNVFGVAFKVPPGDG